MTIARDPLDHCYHPTSDDEIADLVAWARTHHRTVRVRGDGHSVAHAIYADPLGPVDNKVKQPAPRIGRNLNLVLDHYGDHGKPGWRPLPREGDELVIEADAGMVLGSAHDGSGRKGLLEQLHCKGWMLQSTGGIAHQTVAGFIATASAGGSLTTSVSDLVEGVTLIGASGEPVPIDRGHDDFPAVVPNLGLLGVVTKVRLRCVATFTVAGAQVTSAAEAATVDLTGGRRPSSSRQQRSLTDFLKDAGNEYARVEYWPQPGMQRVRLWTGKADARPCPPPGFKEKPFHLFDYPYQQALAGIVLTAIGNRHHFMTMAAKIADVVRHVERHEGIIAGTEDPLDRVVDDLQKMGPAGNLIASLVGWPARRHEGITSESLDFRDLGEREWRTFFRAALKKLAPDGAPEFHDYAYRVLPMDDEVDDLYLPVEFTEIWVPLRRADDALRVLDEYLTTGYDTSDPFAHAGTFEIELYATTPSTFWLHPAYSKHLDERNDPDDPWAEGALRINPYWYGRNPGDPAHSFFPRFWDLLREKNIPYRLHWGKFLPHVEEDPGWPAYIRDQYPQWEKFMTARKRYDPDGIFLNEYWRAHLGLPLKRSRIADMHCHYPMHVLADLSRAAAAQRKACYELRFSFDRTRCLLMKVVARIINSEHWWTGWRVSFKQLRRGQAGLVMAVQYNPVYEVLVVPQRQRPRPTAFHALICQLNAVEADLARKDGPEAYHRVVKNRADLDDTLAEGRTAFVHCVEGGFFLGDSPCMITANVATLAERGVAYITLAHLFYRGIASNVGALPKRYNRHYDWIFRQRERGLTPLGRAAVDAMYKHRMLIDISHMDAAALNATFARLKQLDEETGAQPEDHPIIASHAGYRFGELKYMLDDDTIKEIKRRRGVIGLILARDEIEDSLDMTASREKFYALGRHIDEIHEITGSYAHLCLGSDLDGYTKPTLLKSWEDFVRLEEWLRNSYPAHVADAILFRNAERVVRTALR